MIMIVKSKLKFLFGYFANLQLVSITELKKIANLNQCLCAYVAIRIQIM